MERFNYSELDGLPRADQEEDLWDRPPTYAEMPLISRSFEKSDFWDGLGGCGHTIMREWKLASGAAIGLLLPFLRRTGEMANSVPCPEASDCGQNHPVVKTDLGLVAAGCSRWDDGDDDEGCGPFDLVPEDIAIHAADRARLGAAIASGLGLVREEASLYATEQLFEIGRHVTTASPAYLATGDQASLLREVLQLARQREGPYLLFTTTGWACKGEAEQVLREHGGVHLSMRMLLEARPGGVLVAREAAGPALEAFARVVREAGVGKGPPLGQVRREIEDVRVRGEVAELDQQQEPAPAEVTENEAARVFALMKKLDTGSRKRKAPLHLVFRLLVLEKRTQYQAAAYCKCSESLVSGRAAIIEQRFGMSIERLRSYASNLVNMETAVKEDRRWKKSKGRPDEFDRPEGVEAGEDQDWEESGFDGEGGMEEDS